MKQLIQIFDKLKFLPELTKLGFHTYLVGGSVRDFQMGLTPKDFDFVVEGVEYDDLIVLLRKYGKCELVGDAFGVLLYQDDHIEAEIAVPRIETKTGDSHTDFKVETSASLTILDDLSRRDFTMNAIAIRSDGVIFDPHNGLTDIKKKIIRVVNAKAFSEDPLRMLRGVRFFSRFKHFVFDAKTLSIIKINASKISVISGERILKEFKGILEKGDSLRAMDALKQTGLDTQIFGISPATSKISPKTVAELTFLVFGLAGDGEIGLSFLKDTIKSDLKDQADFRALVLSYKPFDDIGEGRYLAHQVLKISARIADSDFIAKHLQMRLEEMTYGLIPRGLKDLKVNGDDLLALGLKGKEIGTTLDTILRLIYSGKLKWL